MFVGLSGDGVSCANDTPIDIDDAPPPRWVTRLASSRTIPEAPRCNGCARLGAAGSLLPLVVVRPDPPAGPSAACESGQILAPLARGDRKGVGKGRGVGR